MAPVDIAADSGNFHQALRLNCASSDGTGPDLEACAVPAPSRYYVDPAKVADGQLFAVTRSGRNIKARALFGAVRY